MSRRERRRVGRGEEGSASLQRIAYWADDTKKLDWFQVKKNAGDNGF